jgi:hypothetical protein
MYIMVPDLSIVSSGETSWPADGFCTSMHQSHALTLHGARGVLVEKESFQKRYHFKLVEMDSFHAGRK